MLKYPHCIPLLIVTRDSKDSRSSVRSGLQRKKNFPTAVITSHHKKERTRGKDREKEPAIH